jgi:hypothetical protein
MQVENKLPAITHGLTKTQIAELAKFGVDYVLETGQPELVAEQIAVMENYIKAVKADERFTDYVREELLKNKGKITTASGAKIEACETGISYDYSTNPTWIELSTEEKRIAERRKAVEDILKKIPAGKSLVDDETGETLIGPAKTSKSSYKVTLAK